MLLSGVIKDEKFLQDMLKEAAGPINFTMFLTFMGDKLQNTDSDEVLHNAFLTLDQAATGLISQQA